MDIVRPWKDPWGLSPGLRAWSAWALLTDLSGRSRLVGPPPLSRDAFVGPVCCSWHPVRLVWVNVSLACQKIAPGTQHLIFHSLPDFTFIYVLCLSPLEEFHRVLQNCYYFYGILESCGDPEPEPEEGTPPLQSWPGCPLPLMR